jgi:hypothetical protein
VHSQAHPFFLNAMRFLSMNEQDLSILEEKARKLIAESERLRRQHEALLKEMQMLKEIAEKLRGKKSSINDPP